MHSSHRGRQSGPHCEVTSETNTVCPRTKQMKARSSWQAEMWSCLGS
uniref:Complexin 3 n=1 Tax=Mus musculus TaxID=10090 RepID=A0A1L1SUC8_MOUSE